MPNLERKLLAPMALAMAWMLGCGGGGPVAVPPGTDVGGLKPAAESSSTPAKKQAGVKEESGPMPIPQ